LQKIGDAPLPEDMFKVFRDEPEEPLDEPDAKDEKADR
jgi:hypothetical protein